MEWVHVAGITFAALFPLINPLGALPLFASLTQEDSKAFRKQQATKAAIFTLAILVVFEYAGNFILSFFGLSLGMLQIAGGLIVGHTGWTMSTGTPRVSPSEEKQLVHDTKRRKRSLADMKGAVTAMPGAVEQLGHRVVELPSSLHSRPSVDATSTPNDSEPTDESQPASSETNPTPGRPAGQAESGQQSQKSSTPEHPRKAPSGQVDISFSPMAMPMLAGPGAIGIVIGLTAQNPGAVNSIGIFVGILTMSVLTLVCLLLAAQLTRLLGPSGIMAMQRIFGFLVLGIAVALIATGISQLFGLHLHG